GNLFQKTCYECGWLCAGRKIRRAVAYGVCVRDLLFLCSSVCGICRAVWMEVRPCQYLDWHRQRGDRESDGLGGLRETNQGHDPVSELQDYAGLFWKPLWEQAAEDCGVCNRLCLSGALYGVYL